MFTLSKEAAQGALLMVHLKVFVPTPNPVRPEVGEVVVVIVPVPEISVHIPVPTAGALPASVAVAAQIVWSTPALAVVGEALRTMLTSSNDEAQGELLVVHLKVFVPTPNPVSPEEAEVGVVIV